MNSSKTSTSVMLCGNAVGELLPPGVVYRAENLWTTWTEGGLVGCHYNRTKHGWFDGATFEDWSRVLLLPRLNKQQGMKLVIGGNLSTHINPEILQQCEENNIRFVCLPPISIHLTQPLDVAYFAPMK
ncbi:MFS-type transporter clz9-like [Schistocerca americana]|uniref:MFS-type transporter clz9-like n=1 Tax=Schistocerca americana TaxID=7009 RepID=UPI001F4F3F2E|nr:MFS-type transporter clz9-like [Schistocerca americana]